MIEDLVLVYWLIEQLICLSQWMKALNELVTVAENIVLAALQLVEMLNKLIALLFMQ